MQKRFVGLTLCAWTLVGLLTIGNSQLAAQTEAWRLDPPHSAAQFAVRHMGISTVRGTFTRVTGDVQYSATDPGKSSLDITIDAASVDTRVEMRDNDVRSAHFLDTAKYPRSLSNRRRLRQPGLES